jgi:hypothetical protein
VEPRLRRAGRPGLNCPLPLFADPARPQGGRVPTRRVRRAGGCRPGASAGVRPMPSPVESPCAGPDRADPPWESTDDQSRLHRSQRPDVTPFGIRVTGTAAGIGAGVTGRRRLNIRHRRLVLSRPASCSRPAVGPVVQVTTGPGRQGGGLRHAAGSSGARRARPTGVHNDTVQPCGCAGSAANRPADAPGQHRPALRMRRVGTQPLRMRRVGRLRAPTSGGGGH